MQRCDIIYYYLVFFIFYFQKSKFYIREALKVLDDSGEEPKPNGVVNSSIPSRELLSTRRKNSHVATRLMCSKNISI